MTLETLRRFVVQHSLFPPMALKPALQRMGFVQADPIRAPARAQDLILRHRVKNYHAGDLERRYPTLGIEEDFFIVYGFVTRSLQALMHPRVDCDAPAQGNQVWPATTRKQAQLLLEFTRQRGAVHPREVDRHFAHGSVVNYWGGSSNATTHLLSEMHYRGMLRVVRRDAGIRVYTAHEHGPEPADSRERDARIDALADVVIRLYAPLPAACLSDLMRRLRWAVPQWRGQMPHALRRAKERLAHARAGGVDWYWPDDLNPAHAAIADQVRLLAPFDPVVWDRDRLELLWGWVYRFEAYTPKPKRKLGYYALPMLWRDRIIGWANLSVKGGRLISDLGYVAGHPPRDGAFRRELEAELSRMGDFLLTGRQ